MSENLPQCILNNVINEDGTYNYAYATFVIQNDVYASASIVFAESVRKIGCMGKLIVIIDKNISAETIDVLKTYYDEIIKIDNIIRIENENLAQQVILTKLCAFNLIKYKRILLADVDTILFNSPDDILINILQNENMKKNMKENMEEDDCLISYNNDIPNYGFMIITPSNDLYKNSLKLIEKYNKKLIKEKKPFDFVIKKLYGSKHIKKMNFNLSQDKYKDVDGIQYRTDKPFLMKSELTIEERMRLEHFKIWFSYLIKIINKYEWIKKCKFIQEPLDVSKYFLASVSRFIIDFVKLNKDKKIFSINNIYGIANMTAQYLPKSLDFYHLDLTKEYQLSTTNVNIEQKYNSETIDAKDFFENYKKNIFGPKINFTNILTKEDMIGIIKYANKDESNHAILNIILNNYVKTHSNVFIVLKIKSDLAKDYESDTTPLDLKNDLIYNCKFKFNGLVLKNIIFNIFQNHHTYTQRLLYLSSIKNDLIYNVNVEIYETIGQISMIDLYTNNNLFIFSTQNSKIKVCSIFFNSNTIKVFLDNNNLCVYNFDKNTWNNNIIKRFNIINLIFFQTLKKFLYNTYSLEQLENLTLVKPLHINKSNEVIWTIIDNNNYGIKEIKKINESKVYFIQIIFAKLSQYKKILNMYPNYLSWIYNNEYYWELDGIKFAYV